MSRLLVALHFLTAATLVLSTSFGTLPWYGWGGCGLGAALHLWATATMGLRKLRIRPEVDERASLMTTGPYRFLRHPMYAALLLATGCLLPSPWRLWRALVWLALLITLVAKSRREEVLLRKSFAEYDQIFRKTWRLIPLIY